MIRSGTLELFRSIAVNFREVRPSQAQPGLPPVLSGSGGFCRFWSVAPRMAADLADRCESLLVLPSTDVCGLMVSQAAANLTMFHNALPPGIFATLSGPAESPRVCTINPIPVRRPKRKLWRRTEQPTRSQRGRWGQGSAEGGHRPAQARDERGRVGGGPNAAP